MMRIGHLSTFYHTAVLLMAEGGGGKALGHAVEWRLFATGPEIVNAFERGEIDLAYLGLPPAIIGIARGIRIKCVAGGHVEGTVISGNRKAQGYPEQKDLGEILRQFSGLSMGVPGKGSIHDIILRDCLARYDLEEHITVINYSWADQVTEAMAHGRIAGAFGTPALAIALQRYAGGHILCPPSKLWPGNPSYGIVVEEGFLEKGQEVVRQFLLAHEEGTRLLRSEPKRAAKIIASFVGVVDEDFVIDTLRVSPKYCAQLTDGFMDSTLKFVPSMRKLGYIARSISAEEIFDTSLIRNIHPDGDHYGERTAD